MYRILRILFLFLVGPDCLSLHLWPFLFATGSPLSNYPFAPNTLGTITETTSTPIPFEHSPITVAHAVMHRLTLCSASPTHRHMRAPQIPQAIPAMWEYTVICNTNKSTTISSSINDLQNIQVVQMLSGKKIHWKWFQLFCNSLKGPAKLRLLLSTSPKLDDPKFGT